MVDLSQYRGTFVLVAVTGLVLVLGLTTTQGRVGDSDEPTNIFLPGGVPAAPSMPPCTPLRITAGGSDSARTKLGHPDGRWGPFKLKTKLLADTEQAPTLAVCLEAVPEYSGRYIDEQIPNLLAGRLLVGMPMEFALMLMGPPDRVAYQWAVGAEIEAYPKDILWNRPSEFASLKWSGWFTGLWLDSSGRIERLQQLGRDLPAVFVSGDWDQPKKADSGAIGERRWSGDERQVEYNQAMENYRSGEREGVLETLQQLAGEGHPPSQYALGDMYYRGDGVEKDLETAAHWIERAAGSMLPGALYHLGFLQLRGEGTPKDPVAAYVSMRFATVLGNRDAPRVVEQLEGRLSAEELEAAEEIIATTGFRGPTLIHKREPEYPESAKAERVEGSLIVEAIIRADGTVGVVEILECSRPLMGFEEATIEAVSQWSYQPARWLSNGEPLDVYFYVFVDFKLH